MNTLKEIWNLVFRKDELKGKNFQETDEQIGWNIYVPENTTRKEYAKKFHQVHHHLKYKLITPGIILAEKFALPPYKHEQVIDSEYNKELKIFEQSYNQALEDMATIYDLEKNIKNNITTEQAKEKVKTDRNTYRHLKTIKQSTIEINQMDGFYHEFNVFLMHRIYANMAKEFNCKIYNRVLYTSKAINDPNWIIMQKVVTQKTDIELINATETIRNENNE